MSAEIFLSFPDEVSRGPSDYDRKECKKSVVGRNGRDLSKLTTLRAVLGVKSSERKTGSKNNFINYLRCGGLNETIPFYVGAREQTRLVLLSLWNKKFCGYVRLKQITWKLFQTLQFSLFKLTIVICFNFPVFSNPWIYWFYSLDFILYLFFFCLL